MRSTSPGNARQLKRSDRRKARTRQALIDAAVHLIAEGHGDQPSIQEITDAADVGFGSFYNHFNSKEQLFDTASRTVLEQWGRLIDAACAGIDDPALVFATSLRISGRLAWTNPLMAGFLSNSGLQLLDSPGGLARRALRDIRAAESAGRFVVPDAEVALGAVAGGFLALLRLRDSAPRAAQERSVDALTEACLRLVGIDADEAHRLAWLPLPRTTDPRARDVRSPWVLAPLQTPTAKRA